MGKGMLFPEKARRLLCAFRAEPGPVQFIRDRGGADLPWEPDGNWRIFFSFARQPAAALTHRARYG